MVAFDNCVSFSGIPHGARTLPYVVLDAFFLAIKTGPAPVSLFVFFDLHRSVRQSHLHLHPLCTHRNNPTTRQPRSFTQKAFALQLSLQELPLNGQPLYHTHRHTFRHSQVNIPSVNMVRAPRKGSRSKRASPAHSGSRRPARGRWTPEEVSTVPVQHSLSR